MEVDPGKAIEPLQMGKVTFYGESARAIRDAQEVLRAAGAGQLEVVKRAGQGDRPFAVIDGQVFMPQTTIKDAAIDPARISVKVAVNEQGPSLEKDVRRLFREELIGAGAEKAINERLGKSSLIYWPGKAEKTPPRSQLSRGWRRLSQSLARSNSASA